jgi:hypothetical protein
MSTLTVVEHILRETRIPMSVRQIVEYARERLPTRSKTPDTVVARDLSMDLKRKGEDSIFIRTAPGRYTLREIHVQSLAMERDLARQAQTRPDGKPDGKQDGKQDAEQEAREIVMQRPPEMRPEIRMAEVQATSILSSAMREERAGILPGRAPAAAEDEQRTG